MLPTGPGTVAESSRAGLPAAVREECGRARSRRTQSQAAARMRRSVRELRVLSVPNRNARGHPPKGGSEDNHTWECNSKWRKSGNVQMPISGKMHVSVWCVHTVEYYAAVKRKQLCCEQQGQVSDTVRSNRSHTRSRTCCAGPSRTFRNKQNESGVFRVRWKRPSGRRGLVAGKGHRGTAVSVSRPGCDHAGVLALCKLIKLYVYDLVFCMPITLLSKTRVRARRD